MTPRVLKVLRNFQLDGVFIWDRTESKYTGYDHCFSQLPWNAFNKNMIMNLVFID
jgi:hypothetical protein